MVQIMQVLQAATKALDDNKRAVRQEAVRCRQTWYENYILFGVNNLALCVVSSYFLVGNHHLLKGIFRHTRSYWCLIKYRGMSCFNLLVYHFDYVLNFLDNYHLPYHLPLPRALKEDEC